MRRILLTALLLGILAGAALAGPCTIGFTDDDWQVRAELPGPLPASFAVPGEGFDWHAFGTNSGGDFAGELLWFIDGSLVQTVPFFVGAGKSWSVMLSDAMDSDTTHAVALIQGTLVCEGSFWEFSQTASVGPTTSADANRDGEVDAEDLLCVLAAYGSSDYYADVDGSSVVDVSDLIGVVLAWTIHPKWVNGCDIPVPQGYEAVPARPVVAMDVQRENGYNKAQR